MSGSRRTAVLAVLLVVAGAALRLPGLSVPPLDDPIRQYRSAIIARGYVPELLQGLAPEARQAAEAAASAHPLIEPPLMEHGAAWIYRALGREDLAWARTQSVLAWSLGGLAMFWLALQFVAGPAALAAVAVWTFLPFAIRTSRWFTPDPLMTALMVFAFAATVSYERRPTVARAGLLAFGVGAALFVKAVSVFFLAPAVLAVVLLGHATLRAKAVTIGIAIVAAAPAAWYYATLELHTEYGPFPELLRQPVFWRDWAMMIARVVSWPVMVAAPVGMLVASGPLRRLLIWLLAGYVAFGIVFTHHIHTHDYYSLPLVAIVALALGALVDRIGRQAAPRVQVAAAGVVVAVCAVMGVLAVMEAQRSERTAAIRAEAARYERIGQIVGHSQRVLSLDETYGLALNYHGYMGTIHWPDSGDLAMAALTGGRVVTAEERLRAEAADFFVSTSRAQFDFQPDLKPALERRHPLLERDGEPDRWHFVVYDLRRGILSAAPANLSIFAHVGEAPVPENVALYAAAAARWSVLAPPDAGLSVTPPAGTGPATLQVTATTVSAAVDRTVTVRVNSPTDGSTSFDVRIRGVAGLNKPPFGFVDAPADPITLGDAPIVFQGWALDDTLMKRVWVGYAGEAGRVISLGEAQRDGRRPDLAAAFPTAHDLFKAGWAFRLEPSAIRDLPRPLRLQFLAEDGNGQRTEIGHRTVR